MRDYPINATAQADGYGSQRLENAVQDAGLSDQLDQALQRLYKSEEIARDIADKLLGPRPEVASAGPTLSEVPNIKNQVRYINQRADSLGETLGRIHNSI